MYLSRFGVKNYKCLGDIDIPLTPIHVLIGQNDCGKTSLLEATSAFLAVNQEPLEGVFPEPWMGRELMRHGSANAGIELCGEWTKLPSDDSDAPYQTFRFGLSVDFPFRDQHSCMAGNHWIEVNGKNRPLAGRGRPAGRENLEHLGNDSRAVARVLKPAHRYAFDARQMAVPACFDANRKFRLDPDGFGLATLLDDLVSFDPKIFLDIREDLCRFFPQFRSVRISTEHAITRTQSDGLPQSSLGTGKGIYFETQSGETIRARHASDGVVLFLGYLALAHLPDPPNLLLIEEPENGVYPKRLGQVIELLKQLVHRTEGVRFPQIILTTHSPYVLSFFEPEEVTLLSREADGPNSPVRARPLRDAPNIRERLGNDFYLGELWYNLSEGELFGDAPGQSGD